MKLSAAEIAGVQTIASSINVPYQALLAVISVESNGVMGEVINGKLEPLIRYEGHYFDKLCKPAVREAARKAGVSNPKSLGVKNPASQAARWKLVEKAAAFDKDAAYMSCSYGVGQVMGSHYKALGYSSVHNMVEDARSGFLGQVRIMAKFIKQNGLDKFLRALDWSAFARGYNGPNYKVNKYDTKMAAAYVKFGGTETIAVTNAGFLRLGSKGAGVRDLQAMLKLSGFNVNIDGDFGPTTHEAVVAYQTEKGLNPDGIVGPKTQEALAAVRALAPVDAGQEKVFDISEVKKGVGTAIAVPTVLIAAKEELTNLVEQMTPYAYLGKVVETLQTGIAVVTIAGLVIGVGYAAYGWWKSRESYTGTYA